MHEPQTNGPSGSNVGADKPQDSFSSKSARFSLIASAICWVFLSVFVGFSKYISGVGFVFAGLLIKCMFLISLTSFLAGFVGLFAGKRREAVMAFSAFYLVGRLSFLVMSAPLCLAGICVDRMVRV